MDRPTWVARIIERRFLVLVIVGALAGVSLFYSARLSFDSSVEGWFLEDDPAIVAYREFLDTFAGDEISVIGVMAPDVFDPKVMESIDRMTRAAARVPHAHRVKSLTRVKIFDNDGDALEIRPFARRLPGSAAESAAMRRAALSNPLLAGTLVARDARAAAIVVELEGGEDLMARKVAQARALERIIERERRPGMTLHLTGTPALDMAFYDYNERDFRIILPVSMAAVFVIMLLVFRRLLITLIPIGVVGLGVLFTFGLMGAVGIKVNILSTMVAAIILAVGVADAVHVLSDYRRALAAGARQSAALQGSVAHLLVPCLFTSITTAAGFLSLLTSDLQPVREAGWLAAVGVMVAFGLSMTLVPVLLSLIPAPPTPVRDGRLSRMISRVAARLGGLSRVSSLTVVGVSVALVVVVVLRLAVGGLDVGANPIEYFRPGDKIRTATEQVDRHLGGSTSIEVILKAPGEGLKDPRILRRLERLQGYFEAQPGVSRTLSIVDYLKELNRVIHGGDRKHHALPTSRAVIAQYYVLLEGEPEFTALVRSGYSLGRMTARVSFSGSGELSRRLPQIEETLARDYDDEDLGVSITGFVKLMGDMESYLVQSQLESMLIAFSVITVMMFVLLGSVRLGAFAMIPNLVPILLGLGFMAFVGIGLDPGTVMIGSIALGLVVDDTVHFLVQLRRQRRGGDSLQSAISSSLVTSGSPIIITSIVLIAGFCVATLGSFNPNVNFGLISAVVIFLALAADLVILPAALKVLRPRL